MAIEFIISRNDIPVKDSWSESDVTEARSRYAAMVADPSCYLKPSFVEDTHGYFLDLLFISKETWVHLRRI